jgi:hypothetical protein
MGAVHGASGRGESEPQGGPGRTTQERVVAAQELCGRDRIRTCEGNAGDFTGRIGGSSQLPSRPRKLPLMRRDVQKWPGESFGGHLASPPVLPRTVRPTVGRREAGGKPGAVLTGRLEYRCAASATRAGAVAAHDLPQPVMVEAVGGGPAPSRHGLGGHHRVDDGLLGGLDDRVEQRVDALAGQHLGPRPWCVPGWGSIAG